MASRAEDAPTVGREEKGKSVGRRLLSRMRTVLRRNDASRTPKRTTIHPTTYAPPAASIPPPTTPTASTAVESSSQPPVPPESNVVPPEVDDHAATDGVEMVPRSQIYTDRYQKLYKNAGILEVDLSNFYQMDGHVLRVHRTARMRIHRSCHQCGSEISKTGRCNKCDHSFCRQCTRFPSTRTEAAKAANREAKAEILKERAANPIISPALNFDPNAPVVVTRPARPEQQLVYKEIRQRVRRTCCQCLGTDRSVVIFQGGGRDCAKCAHVRCTDCPRDPPKRHKYPYGYPGDAFGAKSIPHYRCHECYNQFPPDVENGTACAKCSHEKCDHCARLKPQKVDSGPDPEVAKSVQDKIAAMSASEKERKDHAPRVESPSGRKFEHEQ